MGYKMQYEKERQFDEIDQKPKIAYILNVFPKLSETFILSEIRYLLQQKYNLSLFALFSATEKEKNPEAGDLVKITAFLSSFQKPLCLLNSHAFFVSRKPLRYFTTLVYSFRKRNIRSLWKLCKSLVRILIFGGKKATKAERQNILVHFFLAPPLCGQNIERKF